MTRLSWLNALPEDNAREELHRCCGSIRWAREVARLRPFQSADELHAAADRVWATMERKDILEAFSHHPRIGDMKALERKWAGQEQSGVKGAPREVLEELERMNREYEKKFGFLFLVCATGKSASEMLAILKERYPNDEARELEIAANEQKKITHIRLEKLLT